MIGQALVMHFLLAEHSCSCLARCADGCCLFPLAIQDAENCKLLRSTIFVHALMLCKLSTYNGLVGSGVGTVHISRHCSI